MLINSFLWRSVYQNGKRLAIRYIFFSQLKKDATSILNANINLGIFRNLLL